MQNPGSQGGRHHTQPAQSITVTVMHGRSIVREIKRVMTYAHSHVGLCHHWLTTHASAPATASPHDIKNNTRPGAQMLA